MKNKFVVHSDKETLANIEDVAINDWIKDQGNTGMYGKAVKDKIKSLGLKPGMGLREQIEEQRNYDITNEKFKARLKESFLEYLVLGKTII